MAKEFFRDNQIPQLVGTHMIDEAHSNRHARLFHTHENELELLFVYSGSGKYKVDGTFYDVQQGDMVVCNAGVLHGEDPSQARNMRSYSIALTNVALHDMPENCLVTGKTMPVLSCGMLSEQIGQMMRMIYLLFSNQNNLKLACTHLAISVLLLVYDFFQSRAKNKNIQPNFEVSLLVNRIQNYLDVHYCEQLSLRSISDALSISESYLAHVFKQETGMPPMQYVMKRRIGEAQSLLMDTLIPISIIAERLGYENPWNFSTAFKKCVGMAPSEYRRTLQNMRD